MSRAYEVLSDPDQRAALRPLRRGRGVRRGRPAAPAATSSAAAAGSATCSTPSSVATPSAAGQSGPVGPPRGQDLEVEADLTFEQAVFGTTLPVTVRTAVRCETCDGQRRRAGHPAGDLLRVRGLRPGAAGPPEPARPDGHRRRPARAAAASGQIVVTPCEACAGHGRMVEDRTYQVDVPAGVDSGSTLRLTGRGAVGPAEVAPATCTSTCGSGPTSATPASATTWSPRSAVSMVQAALGTTRDAADPRRRRGAARSRPARSPARSSPCVGRGVPIVRGRGRGDLRAELVVRGADEAHAHAGGAAAAPGRGAGRARRPAGGQRPAVPHQVRLLVIDRRPEAAGGSEHGWVPGAPVTPRTAAAHVFVASLTEPVLDPDDRHHLERVLRLRPGDGRSRSATAGAAGARSALGRRARAAR